jgi:hypothetical protein
MKVTEARGRLRGKQPKVTLKQEAHLIALLWSGVVIGPPALPGSGGTSKAL